MKQIRRYISCLWVFLMPFNVYSTPNADLPVPSPGWDAANNVTHGEVRVSLNYQTRNHGEMTFTIHLPQGYSNAAQYPVLYLLHGITDDQTTWTSGSKGRAHNIMDNLYSQDMATPMILVMPDGAVGSQGFENAQGYADFEDVLLNDLIPHIEANYSASTEPFQRGLAGLSMGGGQTLNFGFKNYTVFNWIGAFSSAPNTIAATQTIQDPGAINSNVRFSYLSCGTEDGLLSNTNNYHDFLDQNDIGPHMYQLEQGEAHSWTAFNRSLYHFSQRIFNDGPINISWKSNRLANRKIIQMGKVIQLHPSSSNLPVVFNLFGRSFPLTQVEDGYLTKELPSGMYILKWISAGTEFQHMIFQK